MDILKYEVLLRAVDRGSISRAALELDYTQSGISHMMRSLEDEFGFPVLNRCHSGVTLTKDGEKIIPYIRALVQANNLLQQNRSEIKGLHEGSLTIGSLTSITITYLFPVMKAFHADYPNITINLLDGTTDDLSARLSSNSLDIGFFGIKPHMPFNCYELADDPIYAILPLNHPMANQKSFPVDEFKKNRFVITTLCEEFDVISMMKLAGVSMECPFSSRDTYATIGMVENGFGVSIMPKLVLTSWQSKVAAIELDPPAFRRLGMFTSIDAELSPAARKFVDYCKHIIPKL